MKQDSSRRIFLRIVPGAIAGLCVFSGVIAGTSGAFAKQSDGGQSNGAVPPPPKPGGGGLPKPPSPGTTDGTLAPSNDTTNAGPPTQSSPHGPHRNIPDAPKADPKVLKGNEAGIKNNVEKLAELAEQLKKQVEGTDSTMVLSLDMIKKSQEIEKLAHQIATLAKG